MQEQTNQNGNHKKPDKVLTFRGAEPRPYGVTQVDLAEERLYTIEAAKALKQLERKRTTIVSAIERGEPVEPGLRSAKVIPVAPKSYTVNPKPYKKLIVK